MQVKSHAVLGQLGDMDLRLLRVFKAVVDCGGMAAAELELNIGVSTISRHVKDLEVRLA
jgi:DNA-binding transcriptional LysR family regulator